MIDFNSLYKDTIESDADGVHKGKGVGAFFLKPFVDEDALETQSQQGAVKRTIVAAGEDPTQYNLGPDATIYDAKGAIATATREREADTKQTE